VPIPDSVADAARSAFEGASRDDLLLASHDLFALAGLVDREPRLRKALTDPAADPAAKRELLADLVGGRVSDLAASLASDAVAVRLREDELATVLDDLAAEGLFTAAERDGELERVEDEVFRFSRIYAGAVDLRLALTDPVVPDEQKRAVVTDLLAGKASEVTVRLVTELIGRGRTHDLDRALADLAGQAAARRGRVVAEVRTAIELDAERLERLGAALERETGRPVELHVIIDPTVVGSLAVRVGDELYDGTVRRQLDVARERLLAG
jgi:F-type H+-transporting ATPase subunit delta